MLKAGGKGEKIVISVIAILTLSNELCAITSLHTDCNDIRGLTMRCFKCGALLLRERCKCGGKWSSGQVLLLTQMDRSISEEYAALVNDKTLSPKSSFEELLVAHELGNKKAALLLAKAYLNGECGLSPNRAKYIKWLQVAAEQGTAEAQTTLGNLLHVGKDVEQNYKEAAKWYRLAAEQGDAEAQLLLGFLYYTGGKGVEKSMEESIKWLRLSADQSNIGAQHFLYQFYYRGIGVEQSYEEAAKWLRKCAESGNAEDQFMLGVLYCEGKGVEQSCKDAEKWFKLAADHGQYDAKKILATPYEDWDKYIQSRHFLSA